MNQITLWLALTVATLFSTAVASAQSLFYSSNVVGYERTDLPAQADTLASAPLTECPEFEGTIGSVSGGGSALVISPEDPVGVIDWIRGGFTNSGLLSHYVRMTSGALAGAYFDVVSNAAGSLTVDTNGQGSPAVGDTFKVMAFWTFDTLFPIATQSSFTPSLGILTGELRSECHVVNQTPSGVDIYFISGSTWKKVGSGSTDVGADLLRPDTSFRIRHKIASLTGSASTTYINAGEVDSLSSTSAPTFPDTFQYAIGGDPLLAGATAAYFVVDNDGNGIDLSGFSSGVNGAGQYAMTSSIAGLGLGDSLGGNTSDFILWDATADLFDAGGGAWTFDSNQSSGLITIDSANYVPPLTMGDILYFVWEDAAGNVYAYTSTNAYAADGGDGGLSLGTETLTHYTSAAGSAAYGGGGSAPASDFSNVIGTPAIPNDHGTDAASATNITLAATPGPAGPASPGTGTSGVIGVQGEEDWFRFDLLTSAFVSIETTGSLDTLGTLRFAGNVLTQNDESGTGSNFFMGEELFPGTYYVVVGAGSANPSATGSYELHLDIDEGASFPPSPTWTPLSPDDDIDLHADENDTGWVFVDWPHVYDPDLSRWLVFDEAAGGSTWHQNLGSGDWDQFDTAPTGWLYFFSSDTFYREDEGEWYYYDDLNTAEVFDPFSGTRQVFEGFNPPN